MNQIKLGNLYIIYCAASPLISLVQNIRIYQLISFVFAMSAIAGVLSNPKRANRLIISAALIVSFVSGIVHSISWSIFLFDFISLGLLIFPFLKLNQLSSFAKPIFTLGLVLASPFLLKFVSFGEYATSTSRLLNLGELYQGDWYSPYIAISSYSRLFCISLLLGLLPTATSYNYILHRKGLVGRLQNLASSINILLASPVIWRIIHIFAITLVIALGLTLLKVQFIYESILCAILYLLFSFRLKLPVLIASILFQLTLFILASSFFAEGILTFQDKIAYGSEQSRIQETLAFWDSSSFLDILLGHGLGGSSELFQYGGALHMGISNLIAKLGLIAVTVGFLLIIKRLINLPTNLKSFYFASFIFMAITSVFAPNYGIYPLASFLFPCLLYTPNNSKEFYSFQESMPSQLASANASRIKLQK